MATLDNISGPTYSTVGNSQFLTLSEVSLLIKRRFEKNVQSNKEDDGKDDLAIDEGLQKMTVAALNYCNRFGMDKTEEDCLRTRRKLAKLPLSPSEIVTLANLAPENYEEAMAHFPVLKMHMAGIFLNTEEN